MAVNFNLLRQAGPANFYEGLVQGQEQQRANALVQQKMAQEQQKMAQEQEFNALRMQQTRGAISQQERQVKEQTAAQKTAMFRDRLLRAPNPSVARDLVKMQYADPDLGPLLSQTGTLEQALAEVSDDPIQFERYRQQEAMGMTEWIKSQQPKVTPTGDVYDPASRTFIRKPQPERAPVAPSAPVAVMGPDGKPRYVSREEAFGMTPFTPAAVKFMGGGGGGAATPVGKAPPGYRFTPAGDLEAIPGGPAAAKLGDVAAKKEEGVTQATNILDSLEAAYTDLEARKAIPSEKRNAVSNTLASISASAPGQIAERTIGTKAQTQRDIIASSRLQLLNAIKGATGMSSQQLNSNVELTTWLNSLTDPSRSIETNKEILQNVRRFIDSGGTYSAKKKDGGTSDLSQERANANAAIAAGAPAAAVRARFKQNTGQEL
jgi:hypothetical protein